MSPRLDLVVGCNCAGKSTLVERQLRPLLRVPFVNADEIAKQKWPEAPEESSYEAARVAADTRDALIKLGRSFIAETAFSHASKLELVDRAQQAGFRVVLHVVLVPEELAVQRVLSRVTSGGHSANPIGRRGLQPYSEANAGTPETIFGGFRLAATRGTPRRVQRQNR